MTRNDNRVQFRIDKTQNEHGDREVTAVLPDVPENPGFMACYAHCGQHGTCTRDWIHSKTRPAKPAEYAALLAELQAIGYDDLKVVQRVAR